MTDKQKEAEADLAKMRNQKISISLRKKRSASFSLMIVCLASGIAAGFFGLIMTSFCLILVSLIGLLRYFDANGHLHEVSRRSDRTLTPKFSVFHNGGKASATDAKPPLAGN